MDPEQPFTMLDDESQACGAFNKTKRPLIIGVTGGMASGKSTVARMIAGKGILHVDADRLVHQLLRTDHDTIAAIAAAFPQCVVPENEATLHVSVGSILVEDQPPTKSQGRFGSPAREERELVSPLLIHRSKLAAHIAHHPEALGTLEAILHPRVRALEEAAIHAARRNRLRAVVLDVPLLFETDADQLCDVVVVAHATLQHRRRRAFARAGMTEEKWQRLLARQVTEHHRHPRADVVIRTDAGKAATRQKIKRLMCAWGVV